MPQHDSHVGMWLTCMGMQYVHVYVSCVMYLFMQSVDRHVCVVYVVYNNN